ncbi:MAG TPA: cation diffusion facilitator family transporter [Kiritimatiellia bacterium]|nr:cation diffusion facilitator family transporter [Kiritimatiellia bacterium]HRT04395.1 cation diffusion facilitator family transporter [Kiritimatiellia bacterium]
MPSHDHVHDHAAQGTGARALGLAAALTGGMMLAEFVGGWRANSLALISDAGHMLTDVGALLVSLAALKMADTPPDAKRTFGLQRAEILAALFNGATLLALSAYIVYEAVPRLFHPEPIQSGIMMAVAAVGLIVNVAGFFLLRTHSRENLNIRGALLHVLGDLLSSIAVLVGGLFVWWQGWNWLDPLLSLLIAAVILQGAVRVVREALGILLEFAPAHVNTAEIENLILAQPGVLGMHHLHVWSISSQRHALSAHLLVGDRPMRENDSLLDELRHALKDRFSIGHAMFQLERRECDDPGRVSGNRNGGRVE